MKAITIHQPWAHLIASGEKRIENRTWRTIHRGPLAIHAGKSRARLRHGDEERFPDMAFGAIVAVVTLAECLELEGGELYPNRFPWNDPYAEGPWVWVLLDVRRLRRPVLWTGKQMLFDVPDSAVRT